MEDIPLSEQPYTDTESLAIADLSPKRDEECFNFPPRDGTLGGMTVEGFVSKHVGYGTIERYRCQVRALPHPKSTRTEADASSKNPLEAIPP